MSPKLSVIVPVHGVQGYLRQCLESILAVDFSDLEVIAVDDCSPDGSAAILDEFAERDQRVRVRHLTQNVGLGEARNIGLDMATGEYVWFFDSDDYATPGAIRAIYERLAETGPDVLIFDHERGYWNGKTKGSITNAPFRDPPAPGTFAIAERPSVLELIMTAWNKAIRREFLVGLGLRFSTGYYEDINVTYPILMVAERLSLLDRVCYVYRQRRRGAITRTAGPRHFDALAQYERVFAFMDQDPSGLDRFRASMFDRMMEHQLLILESGRIREGDRQRFFGELSAVCARLRPADHVMPSDRLMAAKYRRVLKGSYGAFHRLRSRHRVRSSVLQKGKAFRVGLASRSDSIGKRLRKMEYRLRRRQPIDKDLAVYACYWYRGYACNPRAIYEEARRSAPWIRGTWVVRKGGEASVPDSVDHVVAGTRAYYRLMARAKYFVNNVNFPNDIVKRRGQVHLQTQHGTPLKVMGLEQMRFPVGAGRIGFRNMLRNSERWDFLLSSNPLSSEVWARSFPCRYELLETGYPRNDRYFRVTEEEVARLRAELGVPEGKKAMLYAPTHRDYMNEFEPMIDLGALVRGLGSDHVILLRAHYFYSIEDLAARQDWPEGSVIDVSDHPVVEDVCIASDVLLTDYSSIMFDYANLDDRPIVIYANDWDTYQRTRGVNFDLMAGPPGIVAETEEALIEAFRAGAPWDDVAMKLRVEFRRRFCPYDDGTAAAKVVERVFDSPRRRASAWSGAQTRTQENVQAQ